MGWFIESKQTADMMPVPVRTSYSVAHLQDILQVCNLYGLQMRQ